MSAHHDCLIAGCRWGTAGEGRCECIASLTEGDIHMLEVAARRGVDYLDYDPSAYDDIAVITEGNDPA